MDVPNNHGVEELGLLYEAKEWPHGLMCAECPRAFREGERFTTRLYAFSDDVPMVQIVCLECSTVSRSGSEPTAPRS